MKAPLISILSNGWQNSLLCQIEIFASNIFLYQRGSMKPWAKINGENRRTCRQIRLMKRILPTIQETCLLLLNCFWLQVQKTTITTDTLILYYWSYSLWRLEFHYLSKKRKLIKNFLLMNLNSIREALLNKHKKDTSN